MTSARAEVRTFPATFPVDRSILKGRLREVRSFVDLDGRLGMVPAALVNRIARLERLAGRENRYHRQAPAVLDDLADRARVESVRASSAIEDVVIDGQALTRITRGGQPRTRPEAEVAGYRDALDHLYATEPGMPFDISRLLTLHRDLFGHVDGPRGRLKDHDNRVVDLQADGSRVDRFVPVPAIETPFYLRELHERFAQSIEQSIHHHVLLIGLYILDLLVIHPFDNGNGRVARLATTHLLRSQGYEVVRYVAVEGLVDKTSDDYYASLKASTDGWHQGHHDVWPWLDYLTARVTEGYEAFDAQMAASSIAEGKAARVEAAVVARGEQPFSKAELCDALPGVSSATVSRVLRRLRSDGRITAVGVGPSTLWVRADPDPQ